MALTTSPSEFDEDKEIESFVGFVLLAEGIRRLERIETLLTPKK